MIGTLLLWRPHLGTLANSVVVLAMIAWLWLLFRRYCSLYAVKRSWLLMVPKILFALLLLVALFDPCWRVIRPTDDGQQVVLLTDVSSSMDVADGTTDSRAARAQRIAKQFQDRLRDWAHFKTAAFDVDIHDPAENPGDAIRGTDLGRTLVSLPQKPDLSACKAVVLVTDGGDEAVDFGRLPGVPLYIVGVGTDPSTWNDVAVGKVAAPAEVEVNTAFKVAADILARSASGDFSTGLAGVEVALQKWTGGEFQEVESQTVDLREQKARVEFELPAVATAGVQKYRFAVNPVEGEMTPLNNQRTFQVNVREKKIYVLLYGRGLDWNYALLRRALQDDPTIRLTALYHKNQDVVCLEGSRQEGDEVLSRGFPTDEKVLELYRCIILGSFPAQHLREASLEALKKYVEGGGSVIFLGGHDSFGRGGYAASPIAPLVPWQISGIEREMSAGAFPVMVPAEGVEHSVMSATAGILNEVTSPVLYSINHVGRLRSGAVSLMNASVGDETVAVVALQSYGRGQTLGVATDTLWRWGRMPGTISRAYGQFWRDASRCMCGDFEGGRFLTVRWNREEYRPGEQAVADIRIAGRRAAGEIRLKGTTEHGGKTEELSVDPIPGSGNTFRTKVFFPERGEYVVNLEAMAGGESLDKYNRILHVGSAVNEGAELAVDDPFLESLASRSGGYYRPEDRVDELVERLKARLTASASPHDLPLVSKPDVLYHTLPLYVLLAMLVLVGEWILRRRMNIL